jgi:hypothetical protein
MNKIFPEKFPEGAFSKFSYRISSGGAKRILKGVGRKSFSKCKGGG